jgi:hypothetical protein
MTIKQGSIIECEQFGSHGKPVVAVVGYNNDWAAYEQAYPDQTTPEYIASNGDKIGRDEANALFPELTHLRYRP